jgi:predicted SAM-dependent methyltransferase
MFRRRQVRGCFPAGGSSRTIGLDQLSPEDALTLTYQLLLNRDPDPAALQTHLEPLRHGQRSIRQVVEWITSSREWDVANPRTELGPSLQVSRAIFVRSLPPARRILDLGGTGLNMPEGALIGAFGYPYDFDELVIVDLPAEDRHERYRDGAEQHQVVTSQGTVSYRYHSMTDLSAFEPCSFDLVYMGQAVEHVDCREADRVLDGVHRVLRESGHLALDTPNARVTRLQQSDYVDPDHQYEYTHAEMMEKLTNRGFEVLEAKGLNFAGASCDAGVFSIAEVAGNASLYADIERCYLLSYLCRAV